MRLVAWNCRGLGNGPAVRGLLDVQKKEDPDVLFLSETKHGEKWMESFKWKLNMPYMVVKDSVGAKGGLALFWKKEVDLRVLSWSRYHIDAKIKEEDGCAWRFTGIYGEPRGEEKEKTWKLLRILLHRSKLPWLCCGDFNEILFSCEKEGGAPRAESSMVKFRDVLEECDLHDLGFVGDVFTWRNHHQNASSYTRERLDRAVANSAWRARFPLVRVINGDPRHSDHRPIIVDPGAKEKVHWSKPLEVMKKFEARWLEEEECSERVEEAWGKAIRGGGVSLMEIQSRVLGELWQWDREVLGVLEKRVKNAKRELERIRRASISQGHINKEHLLRYKLERLLDQQHVYWKQRAHSTWLAKGDRNTKFFHAQASERKRRNALSKLKDEGGGVVEGKHLKNFIANQYQKLFLSTAGSQDDEVLDCVQAKVTQEMNDNLAAPFSSDEIWGALKDMGELKAPGADGMPVVFYRKFWSLAGEKVKEEVLDVLNGAAMPEGWNDTVIVLIPKTKSPENLKDLRPISLCNVVYKLISKVLANRLKLVLSEIISPSQSAFVPGRLITDNVLLAYELTHYLRQRRWGKQGVAAIKLDMSKAYDRVEWSFLQKIMLKLGFTGQWVEKVMECVTSVKYCIKVNGDYSCNIHPQRGLRQGDPLSPYLFILCAEGLSAMLQKAEVEGKIEGIRVCREAPRINHLFLLMTL